MPEDQGQPSWDEKMQAIRETLEIAAHQSMKNSDDIAEFRESIAEDHRSTAENITQLRAGIAELRAQTAEQRQTVDALAISTQNLLQIANGHQSPIEKLERRANKFRPRNKKKPVIRR